MPFSDASYDPDTLSLLNQAFEAAWQQLQMSHPGGMDAADHPTTRKLMALKIMDAANAGERDPEQLKMIALRAVDGRDFR